MLLLFTDPWSTIRNDGKRIALKDPASIDRIILADMYDSTSLIRQDQVWLLFGEEEVNPVAVENLLFAAERLQINSIDPMDPDSLHGTERRIGFYHGDKLLLSYQFQTHGDQYMVTPTGSDHNFLVSIAGYSGLNLEKVFSSRANHYREHLLIDLLPSEIAGIEIELDNGEAFHFHQDENGDITCMPSNEETLLPDGSLDDLATRLLFSYFTSIGYEQRAGITAEDLSADGTHGRIARIQVGSYQGENHTLQVFPYHEFPGAEAHMFRALVLHNNDPEALVVNYLYLDVLMRDLSHYFGEK
ncbi:MAG: hypothetical protein ABFS38_11800 [Bacteroidota bacterium]